MSPQNDERRPGGGGESPSIGLADLLQDTPLKSVKAPSPPVNVWCHGYFVVGTRGRCRLVMVNPSCVFCGRPHLHGAKPDFISGKRKASCGKGSYTVLLGAVEGEVAA